MKGKEFEGKLFVFTAPSGAGKTTIVRYLLSNFDFLDFSVSATTREKRTHEREGVDYYFLSPEEFRTKVENNEFVEWEEVYEDQYYGTLKSEVERIWSKRKHIVFDIDVRGAVNIKNMYGDQCFATFVKPPSLEILIHRLKARKTEDAESLRKRISRVKREMLFQNNFDRILVNDMLDVSFKEAEIIIKEFLKNSNEQSSHE